MDNLNNENFFNTLHAKHPQGMAIFNKWLEDYKQRLHWPRLFNAGIDFQHLPYPLQAGIMIEFFKAHHPEGKYPRTPQMFEVKEFFKYMLVYVLGERNVF